MKLTIIGPLEHGFFPETIFCEAERAARRWWHCELLCAGIPEALLIQKSLDISIGYLDHMKGIVMKLTGPVRTAPLPVDHVPWRSLIKSAN